MTDTSKPPEEGAAPKRAAAKKSDVPQVGDVVLHATTNRFRDRTEDQALVVVGHQEVRMTLDDPNDERRETHLQAVVLGWVQDLHQVPKTTAVPVVAAGAYAQLRPGEYRLP